MGEDIVRHSGKPEITDPLGFKAPLAYTSSFYFVARKNGVERKYMMYEGEEENMIDLMYESKTSEPNGVKVTVPVKYNDRNEFVTKIKEQLAYFETVYFDIPTSSVYNDIKNDFAIFRGEDYQYSEMTSNQDLHLCLDNVYYPIDWIKLGISKLSIPVGLRFTLADGIYPIPSRESIRYTQDAKKTILEKIRKVVTSLVEKYNESITVSTDIMSIFNYYSSNYRYVKLYGESSKKYDISTTVIHSDVKFAKPQLEGVTLLDLAWINDCKDTILGEYKISYICQWHKMKEIVKSGEDRLQLNDVKDDNFYIFDERLGGNKKEYLKSLFDSGSKVYFVRKTKSYPLGNYKSESYYSSNNLKTYYSILRLKKYPKDQWRQVIKEFQYVQSLFTGKFMDADKIEISQKWFDDRKKQRISVKGEGRKKKLEGEINGKLGKQLERYVDGRYCKFVPDTFKLQDLHKKPYLMVYDKYDRDDNLNNLYHISSNKHKMRCISFSDREYKALEKIDIHNLISYENFMKGHTKPFKRLITSYLIDKLIESKRNTFNKLENLRSISKSLYTKLQDLQNYKNNYYSSANSKIYQAMLNVAEKYKLFDPAIYSTYVEIKDLLEKLPFIDTIMTNMNCYNNNKELKDILCDLFKYYKHRIDYTNYNLTLGDSSWMDEALTEDTIEQLLENETEVVI